MACTSTSTISFGPRFTPRTAPITFWYLIILAVFWLGAFFARGLFEPLGQLLGYHGNPATQPWAVLTWPLVMLEGNPFWVFLAGYVMWWAGSDTEMWWGSRVHAGFLLVTSVATALLLTLGGALGLGAFNLAGPNLPLGACLTIWSLRHLRAPVMLIIVPATGWILLVITLLTTWMSFGPVLGIFAMAGACGLPALYYFQGHRLHRWLGALRKSPTQPKGASKRESAAKAKAERERQERDKRVQEIFERSGLHSVDEGDARKR